MSSQSFDSIDRAFWPSRNGPFDEHATIFWRFSLFRDVQKVTIFMDRDGGGVACTLHMIHAPILAFLDYSVRHYIAVAEASATCHDVMMAHYYQRLWKAVEKEIIAEDQDKLAREIWRSSVLQSWAVRTGQGFSHSDSGRNKCHEYCKKNRIALYSIDIITTYRMY
jgi:hypothetical protein